MSQRADDFLTPVRVAIAQRAAYICSNPDCRRLCISPAHGDGEEVVCVGRAAHILAASEGGARYDASQTSEERRSIGNAIFLCTVCADLIDKNKGVDFSAALIRQWKQTHDEWIRSQLNKDFAPAITTVDGEHSAIGIGKVTGLDVQGPAFLRPGTRSSAAGIGEITGTRIGGQPRKE